jgi:hypothetical protein
VPLESVSAQLVFRDMVPIAIIDRDATRPGTRVANLGDFVWAFVHPAVYGDGEPAARMLRAAVDEYGYRGEGPVEAMLAPNRSWVRDDPHPGEWGLGELEYVERNAPLRASALGERRSRASSRRTIRRSSGRRGNDRQSCRLRR